MSEAAAVGADHEPLIIGRYALFDALASGGMATVHLGRLLGAVGFGRTVAVKRLHSHYTTDQDFVTMFMDEARIVARIRHPNVVPMVDVIESSKGLFLIMEYVHGESYSKLLRTCRAAKEDIPLKMVNAVMHGVLLGLHAAHETKGAHGELLNVVHRDVSPQNVIVGSDGVARVLDFGVAKAAGRAQVTREGQIKGKLAYMAPEQIRGKVDRRADIFAAAVILWESLAGRRLHEGAKDVEIVTRVVQGKFPKPSEFRPDIPPELDEIIMRGLEVDPDQRYQNAREMAIDLERKVGLAAPSEVGEWVERLAHDVLKARAERVAAMEKVAGNLQPAESVPPPAIPSSSLPPGYLDDADGTKRSGEYTALMPGAPLSSPRISGSGFGGMPSDVHTGTPGGTELPFVPEDLEPPQPRRDLAPVIALISFCVALALIGAVLGGWSLMARSSASSSTSSTASSSSAAAPTASTVETSSSASPSSSSSSSTTAPSSSPTTKPSLTASTKSSGGGASTMVGDAGTAPVSTTTTAAAAPTTHAQPVRPVIPAPSPPPASSTKKPAVNPNCDPPYTVDENGHRKYKLECMDGN